MSISCTSELLTENVSACVANLKLQLIREVDRLLEDLQTDLVKKLGPARAPARQDLRVLPSALDDDYEVVLIPRTGLPYFGHVEGDGGDEGDNPYLPLESLTLSVEDDVTSADGIGDADAASSRASAGGMREGDIVTSASDGTAGLSARDQESEAATSVEPSRQLSPIPEIPHDLDDGSKGVNGQDNELPDVECPTEYQQELVPDEGRRASWFDLRPVKRQATSQLWLTRTSSQFSDGLFPKVKSIVGSTRFESFFSIIIVLNCATMGIDAQQTVVDDASDAVNHFLIVTEHVFTGLFSFELFMRYLAHGWRGFIPNSGEHCWNAMDAVLVIITGILFTWLIPLLSWAIGFSADNSVVPTLTTLRAARLLRLVRVLQRIPAFREAWMLLRGLTDSMRTLFWTCFVIMFVTYIFAVFGLVLIAKSIKQDRDTTTDEDLRTELTELLEFVGGLDLLMYTLIQLLTMDSWNGIVRRLIKQISWCWAYFYAYIAVACFVLMNLVTAIIVDNAVSKSREDEDHVIKAREKKKVAELKELEALFLLMDSDGSGTLSWEEFKTAFDSPELTRKWKLLDFDPDECKELFGLLDDGDGEIETREFFEGLAQMKGVAQSKDVFRLRKMVESMTTSKAGSSDGFMMDDKAGSSSSKEYEACEAQIDVREDKTAKLPATSYYSPQEERLRRDVEHAGVQTKILLLKDTLTSFDLKHASTQTKFVKPIKTALSAEPGEQEASESPNSSEEGLDVELPVLPTCPPSSAGPGGRVRI